jgi:hypothetical protein
MNTSTKQGGRMALKQVTFQATVTLTVDEEEVAAGLDADKAARHYLESGAQYMNAAYDAGATQQIVTYNTGWRNAGQTVQVRSETAYCGGCKQEEPPVREHDGKTECCGVEVRWQ